MTRILHYLLNPLQYLIFLLFVWCILFGTMFPAWANSSTPTTPDKRLSDLLPTCKPTPNIEPDYIPLHSFRTSNNLRRKTGAVYASKGIYIQIHGRLIDRFCIPIQNASIRLWQADANGKYIEEYQFDNPFHPKFPEENIHFGYTGKTYTNNLGEFNFITILPGSRNTDAPRIYVTIEHPDFTTLETVMFFAYHPKNNKDPLLSTLSNSLRERVIAHSKPLDEAKKLDGRIYEWRVVLEGQNQYKSF